ncbi:dihydroxyacetone kinase subunit L [Stappia sp. F7233]|uniref:Dihydroxyacetone kinase subunit L n=1 Tax=Stappia albiluteola TaxID=2758565 RepID=A0A839ABY3_9HYPH|nr:dihydroxyacetone kinase subunit DhaL [Stappia albiluteola]MBA5776676.1 dihydroxyacetone kinase subunit L [Stappia albiluteola]
MTEAGNTRTRRLIEAVAATIIEHTGELTELDSAIGDGDHGQNMKRGMTAILDDLDAIAAKPLPEALKAAGTQLVMKVGGASGPLYGTLFMALGKEIAPDPTRDDLTHAFAAAIEAVKVRGKSDAGQKTMLDVLVPVCEALRNGGSAREIDEAAEKARDATRDMQAQKGRASFLRERSIGHIDPGARSSQLMIAAVIDVLGEGA